MRSAVGGRSGLSASGVGVVGAIAPCRGTAGVPRLERRASSVECTRTGRIEMSVRVRVRVRGIALTSALLHSTPERLLTHSPTLQMRCTALHYRLQYPFPTLNTLSHSQRPRAPEQTGRTRRAVGWAVGRASNCGRECARAPCPRCQCHSGKVSLNRGTELTSTKLSAKLLTGLYSLARPCSAPRCLGRSCLCPRLFESEPGLTR